MGSPILVSGAAGTAGGALPVTADYSGTFNASATSGKFALFNAVNTNLACGSELAGTLVDKIAYGTATCFEGTVCGGLTTTSGAVRNLGGMTDTDNNASDFTVTTSPVPHNKNSATNPNCSVVPTRTSTWGAIKSIYR